MKSNLEVKYDVMSEEIKNYGKYYLQAGYFFMVCQFQSYNFHKRAENIV